MKRTKKKLALDKRTIRTLTAKKIAEVAGAATTCPSKFYCGDPMCKE